MENVKNEALELLNKAKIILTEEEKEKLEITDLGLGDIKKEGLQIITYVNNDRYCAKELIMLPKQTCPEHYHPPIGNLPGKMETFRCRWGIVYLYVDGEETTQNHISPPNGKEKVYTVKHEIVLHPGEQFTIMPGVKHWFQAGEDGAIVSEFSSTSRDEYDVFTDSEIKRV